jgi:hypothetical protein
LNPDTVYVTVNDASISAGSTAPVESEIGEELVCLTLTDCLTTCDKITKTVTRHVTYTRTASLLDVTKLFAHISEITGEHEGYHMESHSLASWMLDQSRLTNLPVVTILMRVYVSLIPGLMDAMTVTSATTKRITPISSAIDNNGNWTQVRKAAGAGTTNNQAQICPTLPRPSRRPINLCNGFGINGWNSTTLSTLTVSRATA